MSLLASRYTYSSHVVFLFFFFRAELVDQIINSNESNPSQPKPKCLGKLSIQNRGVNPSTSRYKIWTTFMASLTSHHYHFPVAHSHCDLDTILLLPPLQYLHSAHFFQWPEPHLYALSSPIYKRKTFNINKKLNKV